MLYGIAIGFNFMSVFGFYAISLGVPLWGIYVPCAVMCIAAMCWYLRIMDHVEEVVTTNKVYSVGINDRSATAAAVEAQRATQCRSSRVRLSEFWRTMREYKQWFFMVLPHGIILTLDLFALNFFCTVSVENVPPSSSLPLFGR